MSYIKWEMPTDDGLREVCRIVSQQYLCKVMGVNRTIVSFAIKHTLYNGKPYYLPSDKVEVANRAIQRCAKELRQVVFSTEPLSQDEHPYSYGDTPADQMRVFRERFKTRYILIDSMGWTDTKMGMYFNCKTHPYYNKVSQDDLALINRMVQMAANDLERIVLSPPTSPSEGEEEELDYYETLLLEESEQ